MAPVRTAVQHAEDAAHAQDERLQREVANGSAAVSSALAEASSARAERDTLRRELAGAQKEADALRVQVDNVEKALTDARAEATLNAALSPLKSAEALVATRSSRLKADAECERRQLKAGAENDRAAAAASLAISQEGQRRAEEGQRRAEEARLVAEAESSKGRLEQEALAAKLASSRRDFEALEAKLQQTGVELQAEMQRAELLDVRLRAALCEHEVVERERSSLQQDAQRWKAEADTQSRALERERTASAKQVSDVSWHADKAINSHAELGRRAEKLERELADANAAATLAGAERAALRTEVEMLQRERGATQAAQDGELAKVRAKHDSELAVVRTAVRSTKDAAHAQDERLRECLLRREELKLRRKDEQRCAEDNVSAHPQKGERLERALHDARMAYDSELAAMRTAVQSSTTRLESGLEMAAPRGTELAVQRDALRRDTATQQEATARELGALRGEIAARDAKIAACGEEARAAERAFEQRRAQLEKASLDTREEHGRELEDLAQELRDVKAAHAAEVLALRGVARNTAVTKLEATTAHTAELEQLLAAAKGEAARERSALKRELGCLQAELSRGRKDAQASGAVFELERADMARQLEEAKQLARAEGRAADALRRDLEKLARELADAKGAAVLAEAERAALRHEVERLEHERGAARAAHNEMYAAMQGAED